MNDPRGSLWRKWELHLHTPESYDYKDNSVTSQDIIDVLLQNQIGAVAVTDHHFIGVGRIEELRKIARDRLTIFPGIEVRTDYTGDENIHLVGIYPENANTSLVWTQLQSLGLHPDTVKKRGDDSVYVKFDDFCKMVHDHGGIVTIHAGHKSGSVENIVNSLPHKIALKNDLLECYDVFEVGRVKDIPDYKEHVLPNIRKRPPIIMCSDNHNIRKYSVKESCWIKADTTFSGLLQILREPDDRVFVGGVPPVLERVSERPSKYIKAFYMKKVPQSPLDEQWFDDVKIELNPEMAAIIGNKGSGKSALSDSMGLSANSKNYDDFSFLNESKFCKRKGGNKAKQFSAQLHWFSDAVSSEVLLSDRPDDLAVEKVKYIPQKFFERLCNEEDEAFQQELERVVFDLVEDKAGKENLQELINFLSEPERENIEALKLHLNTINKSIAELERLATDQERNKITNRLKEKRLELEAIVDPEPVTKPDEDSPELKVTLTKIEELKARIAELKTKKAEAEERKVRLTFDKNVLNNVLRKIENFRTEFDRFVEEIQEDLDSLTFKGLKASQMLTVDAKVEELKKIEAGIDSELEQLTGQLDSDNKGSIAEEAAGKGKDLEVLQQTLDRPNKDYQKYLATKAEREQTRREIEGSEDKTDTIKYIEGRLKYIDEDLSREIEEKYADRLAMTERIFLKKEELKTIREKLFGPITRLILENKDLPKDYPITLEVAFKMTGFDEAFLGMLNLNAAGSFRGKDEGAQRLRSIREGCDLNDKSSLASFLNELIDSLKKDKRPGKGDERRDIHSQILGEPEALYDFLFGLDYLEPYYELKLDHKSLSQLSPGERGYLLLVFYLFIDKGDIPLIVDQPEENLDNQSVFELLVPCIKEVKRRRQLVIVTHNPNIAVVCDAEQIIHAKIDKTNKCRVSYTTGSIENPQINQKIVEVLEGTLPAFNKRDSAYDVTRAQA
jgi:ABC-type lipoprotein export system ATPase subunit